jgi:hypothetical protein
MPQSADQHCLVENTSTLRLQESVPMGRSWNKSGVPQESSLCTEFFGVKEASSSSSSNNLRRSSDAQVGRQTPRLDAEFGYGKCILSRPDPPKHRKFFSSHLALSLFVNNKFIELQPGGYFVCTRPDLVSLVPSVQTPVHLYRHYNQVVEYSHASLPLGWTSSTRI